MSHLPNLLWLRSFEAVSRLGSFTAAGDELGLTQAAVSTHIRALETQLGHELLARSTRKLDLTESGRAYLPAVRKALQELNQSTQALFGKRLSGSVTIRAPISSAAMIIAPALPAFQEANPHLTVRLLSAIWADTALDTDTQIEVRLGNGDWPGCVAERLGTSHAVAVCHPDLLPETPSVDDLLSKPLIHILGFENHWMRFCEAAARPLPEDAHKITVDTSLAAIEYAAAKGGTALILDKVANRLQADNRLTVPVALKIPMDQSHYLVRRDKAPAPSAAATLTEAWIRQLFAD
ncbi:LysR family transcriptional regulator [Roseibium denhamense]|uniref:LysR family transcriptional regulator, glycine cleavage system transcriptional activator n=1 Tax=Roseibium denhamense TaxID=76305 RepID=A0ABY1N7Z2_9HYPH|nr:LysR substrate-binding domain-containing protein [Roseibium denhamense]MTI06006.1 LysR family transcriptional regulator [Roseibium denhamense]SMP02098.1 LysR family transcriptional regulator, glycine cleavage system transcriptional activator [Roseibium denhamense]